MSETKDGMTKWLTRAALGAALVLTASAEYELARRAGYGEWVSAALPVALDAYVIAALRARREVLVTVLAAVVVNALSHLVDANHVPMNAAVIVGVSALAPLILWRVHVLVGHGNEHQEVTADTTEADTPAAAFAPPVFTRSDLLEVTASLADEVAHKRPVLAHGWSAYGAEVPPAKGAVNTPENGVNAAATTDLQARVRALLDAGHGVRETARRAGCSPSYVSKVKATA